jgi:NADPH2:quinone reductase
MVAAVRVHKYGGPEVLTFEEIEVGAPGQGQVKVKQHACGVNFIDTYFRMGMYPSPVGLPFVSGNEGAGEVVAVGPGVTDLKVGDRVGYVTALGCYAGERLVAADRAVKIPASISYEQAAAMMLKGMTVEYLVRRTFKVQKGQNVSSCANGPTTSAPMSSAPWARRRRRRSPRPMAATTPSFIVTKISSPAPRRSPAARCAR